MRRFTFFAATLMLLSAASVAATQQTIFTFPGGSAPGPNLTLDSNGNLYGTTFGDSIKTFGTVYQLSLGSDGIWRQTTLYSFKGKQLKDGDEPDDRLVFDKAGNLYGTTIYGGVSGGLCGYYGCGTVFKLTPNGSGVWTESVLYRFYFKQGLHPSGLIIDSTGNLYGATGGGGTACDCGTVFKFKPALNGTWTHSILHAFTGGTDGAGPGSLVFDKQGNLFGTTLNIGTVFQLSHSGSTWTKTLLHTFSGTDGFLPVGIVLDGLGNIYGATLSGGDSHGNGLAFKLTSGGGNWTETILHVFNEAPGDVLHPVGAPVLDSAGNLYGATDSYQPSSGTYGNVYELTPTSSGTWNETVLHNFPQGSSFPRGGLTRNATRTSLFGTTSGQTLFDLSTVYEIALP